MSKLNLSSMSLAQVCHSYGERGERFTVAWGHYLSFSSTQHWCDSHCCLVLSLLSVSLSSALLCIRASPHNIRENPPHHSIGSDSPNSSLPNRACEERGQRCMIEDSCLKTICIENVHGNINSMYKVCKPSWTVSVTLQFLPFLNYSIKLIRHLLLPEKKKNKEKIHLYTICICSFKTKWAKMYFKALRLVLT